MVFVLRGQLTLSELILKAAELTRYFFDAPRARIKQAPQAIHAALELKESQERDRLS
jgi:hypothetical protein